MMPVTRDLWNELIRDAEENPKDGCGRRALHLAIVMQSIEQHDTLLIIQFSPTIDRLLFTPWNGYSWATHYATIKDDIVYDPAIKVPLKLQEYLPRAFPEQEVKTHYYHPKPEIPFKPQYALTQEQIREMRRTG